MLRSKPALYIGTVISLALVSVSAHAEQCSPITSLPVTISAPGNYCLQSDLNYTANNGIAITIASNDVTIDLNNKTLSGPYHDSTPGDFVTYAIRSSDSRENTTIKNGIISGFRSGISLHGAGYGGEYRGIHIKDITFKDTMNHAFSTEYAEHVIIENNRVYIDQTLFTSGGDTDVFKVLRATGTTIKNNHISVIAMSTRYTRAIETLQSEGFIIKDNSVTYKGNIPTYNTTIWGVNLHGGRSIIEGNSFVNMPRAIIASGNSIVYRDNTVTWTKSSGSISGGSDGGGNVVF